MFSTSRKLIKYKRYDETFGSDFTIDEVTREANLYLGVPFLRHHVLALRAAGGLSDGDLFTQGVFQLGGYTFEMESGIEYETKFFLRGYEENTFAGDRVVPGTVEYRFPLWFPQRTMWNGRILWDSIVRTAFFETGDAWNHSDDDADLNHSAEGELTLNLGLRHGRFPLSLGVGFAHGFDEDNGESHGSDLYFMEQFYHRHDPDAKENYVMTVLRYPFRDIHELQIGMAYEIEHEILIVYPEVTFSLADAASLVLTGVFIEGDVAGTSMSRMKDKILVKLEYCF